MVVMCATISTLGKKKFNLFCAQTSIENNESLVLNDKSLYYYFVYAMVAS